MVKNLIDIIRLDSSVIMPQNQDLRRSIILTVLRVPERIEMSIVWHGGFQNDPGDYDWSLKNNETKQPSGIVYKKIGIFSKNTR